MESNEMYVASESMSKFFNNLLALKKFVRRAQTDDTTKEEALKTILSTLESIIKEKK